MPISRSTLPILLALFLTGHCLVQAQTLLVKVNPFGDQSDITYQALGDEVHVTTGDSFPVEVCKLSTLEKVNLRNYGGKVQLLRNGKKVGTYASVSFWCQDSKPKFNLISESDKKNPLRTYYDHLIVRPKGNSLQTLNKVYIENYVRGVVFAEAGHHKSLEFFKVQAVSARTYAMANLGKRKKFGYDLTDNTSDQVYRGVIKNQPLIEEAVSKTAHKVIVYGGKQLIEAVFSANCGGYTANSEDVWIAKVQYLRAVPDYNFCEGFNNHAWHMTIPKVTFLEKLGKYHKVEAKEVEIIPDMSGRIKKIVLNRDNKLTVSGEELRRLFKFKSSKFQILESGNLLFIEGLGFGHGVGMCQDGAYHLSEMGLDYEKIVRHYYQEVEIIPISQYLANKASE